MPPGSTTFTDLVRGEVTFDHAHVPDFTLTRADGTPLYTLAVAVDDVLMKITHVVRGEDLLSSTPRQIAVYRAMGVDGGPVPRLRPPALRARQRRPAALQAQRGRVRQLVPRAGLPAGGDLQLPGAARVVAGGEPGGVHDGRDGRRVRPGPGEQERGPVRRAASWRRSTGTRSARSHPADFAARITPFLAGDGLVATPPTAAEAELIAAAAPLVQERVATLAQAARCSVSCSSTRPTSRVDPEDAARVLTPGRRAGAGGGGGGAGRARALDGGGHQGGAGGGAGGRAGPQAAGGVRRGGAGRGHRAGAWARRCSSRSSCWAATVRSAGWPGRGSSSLVAASPGARVSGRGGVARLGGRPGGSGGGPDGRRPGALVPLWPPGRVRLDFTGAERAGARSDGVWGNWQPDGFWPR